MLNGYFRLYPKIIGYIRLNSVWNLYFSKKVFIVF